VSVSSSRSARQSCSSARARNCSSGATFRNPRMARWLVALVVEPLAPVCHKGPAHHRFGALAPSAAPAVFRPDVVQVDSAIEGLLHAWLGVV
jgi:hypothetical protein